MPTFKKRTGSVQEVWQGIAFQTVACHRKSEYHLVNGKPKLKPSKIVIVEEQQKPKQKNQRQRREEEVRRTLIRKIKTSREKQVLQTLGRTTTRVPGGKRRGASKEQRKLLRKFEEEFKK